MTKTRQVIIGNSAAGLSCINAIREVDRTCPVVLISVENSCGYSPVLLTYYLKGTCARKDLFFVGYDFYVRNNVETLFGHNVTNIDPCRRMVYLDDGRGIEYENLLIATGASPSCSDIPCNSPDKVFSLRTLGDADRIAECARSAKEVVIIGGGLVGMQITNALFKKGCKFTVLVSSNQLLSQNFDADCASIIQNEVESYGINVSLRTNVIEVKQKCKRAIVVTDSGKELSADMVLIGKGVRPNTQMAIGNGIKMNQGILVDRQMRTNIDHIFAAGDVAEGENMITGEREVLSNWCNACSQGRVAGMNMAGQQELFGGGLRQNISTLFGLTIVAIGMTTAPKDGSVNEVTHFDLKRKTYRKILYTGGRIVGAVLAGKTADAGLLRSLIAHGRDISRWRESIANIPLDMRALLML